MTPSLPDASVHVRDLKKHYAVHEKEPGFMGSLRSFVSRKTRDVEAVRGVSFDLPPGEVVGFLGPNGAGKTTTLKMLSGLLHPSGGTARVGGLRHPRTRDGFPEADHAGHGPEAATDLGPARAWTAFWSIRRSTRSRTISTATTMREFTEVPRLDGILKKQVRKLSLGERMKCELAAALLHRPKVLFLDEPTIGLDVNMQEAVRDFIREYNRRYGATVMLTSHYMADVTALAQRILVIDSRQAGLRRRPGAAGRAGQGRQDDP